LCFSFLIRFVKQSLVWRNVHNVLLELVIVVLPLDLPVYVLLWVLDWLKPMSHYPDMHLLKKVRLIEGLRRSRAVVKAMHSVTNSDEDDDDDEQVGVRNQLESDHGFDESVYTRRRRRCDIV
jgi:hypothetical protein